MRQYSSFSHHNSCITLFFSLIVSSNLLCSNFAVSLVLVILSWCFSIERMTHLLIMRNKLFALQLTVTCCFVIAVQCVSGQRCDIINVQVISVI